MAEVFPHNGGGGQSEFLFHKAQVLHTVPGATARSLILACFWLRFFLSCTEESTSATSKHRRSTCSIGTRRCMSPKSVRCTTSTPDIQCTDSAKHDETAARTFRKLTWEGNSRKDPRTTHTSLSIAPPRILHPHNSPRTLRTCSQWLRLCSTTSPPSPPSM